MEEVVVVAVVVAVVAVISTVAEIRGYINIYFKKNFVNILYMYVDGKDTSQNSLHSF